MITTKVEPLDREVGLILAGELSPAAQARAFAQYAREQIDEARAVNLRALGLPPPFEVFVDGQPARPLESVKPSGVIVAEFALLAPVLTWIDAQLRIHSPVRSGRYRKSHRLFADGVEASLRQLPPGALEFAFVPTVPYARLIEPDPRTGRKAQSKQAPDGVYQVVAALARKQFGKVGSISFGWREVAGMLESARARRSRPGSPRDMRQPSIIVKVG